MSLLLIACLAAFLPQERRAKPLEGAVNHLDVVYLPDRVTGRPEDRWVRMNIHVPEGKQVRPCILFVHGGGYGGGDKDDGFARAGRGKPNALQRALKAGFVVANLNYILGRDLFPQVFYDFRAAVRFLRKNADTYGIDPDRIGAWGFSAGGWLASSASFCEAGDLYVPGTKTAVGEGWSEDDPRARKLLRRIRTEEAFMLPMESPHALYPEYSARLQALQADFHQYQGNVTPAAPAVLTYVGEHGVSRLDAPMKAAGVPFVPLVLRHPRKNWSKAHSVHVPPLEMTVPAPDGEGALELADRVLQWFKVRLIDRPETPVPEFRPFRRVFHDAVRVEVVMPSKAAVHYTLDGTEPTIESPLWTGAVELKETGVVKAMAVRPGLTPSRVATARFVSGDLAPEIVVPGRLPPASVGKAYETRFNVKGDRPAAWRITAQHRPDNMNRFKGRFPEWTGLTFDRERGVLAGVPIRPGAYTLLIQAAWTPEGTVDCRAVVLVIDSSD